MIRLGAVTGMPVVWQGKWMGRIEQTVLQQSGKSLRGFVIRKGMSGAKWLNDADISLIGGVSILCRHKPGRLPHDTDFALTSVKDASGLRLGWVTDVLLDPVSRRVEALEISLGPLEEWRHGRALLREFVVRPVPGEPGQVLAPCGSILESLREGR